MSNEQTDVKPMGNRALRNFLGGLDKNEQDAFWDSVYEPQYRSNLSEVE